MFSIILGVSLNSKDAVGSGEVVMIASYVPSTSEAHRVLRRTHKSGQLNL